MADGRLTTSLQESTLTLLTFDAAQGALAAGLVSPDIFDEPYRDIATRVLDYRKKFRKPPGEGHLDDLFDHVLADPNHKQHKIYRRILEGLLDQKDHLNPEYVSSRVTEFIRQQTLKGAVFEAAQRINQGGDDQVVDVENVLYTALKSKAASLSAGIFLNSKHDALSFLDRPNETFPLGIPLLDRVDACPEAKTMLLFLAPKGRGKSWFAVHCAKEALLRGKRVVHITLEMPEQQVVARYFQALFAISKRDEKFKATRLVLDELGRLQQMKQRTLSPVLHLSDPNIKAALAKKMDKWGSRLGNVVVKAFPSGSLTVPMLCAYLDSLEQVHNFVPHMCIVDYPDLMRVDRQNPRHSISQNFIDLRGVFQDRNMAGVCPTQTNRKSVEVANVREEHVAEDFSKLQTADKAIIYSQTDQEQVINVARLYVDKNRGDKGHFTVLISQAYTTGQFVNGYAPMGQGYWDLLTEVSPKQKKDS